MRININNVSHKENEDEKGKTKNVIPLS